jgi:hypothetical protein
MLTVTRRKLLRPSGFAYPGTKAGFNPAHPVAASCRFSGVSTGANFVDLTTGKPGVASGSPVSVMTLMGQASTFSTTTNNIQFSGKPTGVPPAYTLACILIFTSVPSGTNYYFATSNSAAGASLQSPSAGNLAISISGATGFISTIVPAANVPYFWAGSVLPGTGPNAIGNIILTNLQTGTTLFQSTTNTISTPTTDTGTCTVGNRGTGVGNLSSMAAAMYTTGFTPMAQLLAFAQDPWAFWYPK